MAYKFQLGKARMSGSLEQEGDISLATGSGADVIGIEASLGSGQYLAQLGYDSSTSTGKLEIADGSTGGTVFSVLDVLSGSAMDTLAGSGLAFNQGSGVMSVDIDELTAGSSPHQTQDHFIYSDNGTEKKITFSDLEDAVFANVSGDALIAAGGGLTIQPGAVEGSMVADDLISGQGAMTGDLDDTDELLVSDNGTLKRADFSVVRDAVFNDVSSQASVAAGGAFSLTAVAITGQADLGGASMAAADELLINDDGAGLKRVNFSDFEDSIFANVSSDVTIAPGGAATIAAAAVHHGMLNDDIISGQSELAHADIQDADDLMIHDATAGAVLKVGVDSLRDHYFGVVSGDASIADGGALTFAPAQTNITSLLATDIKIGEDDNTKIDFETPNEIHFYADSVEQVYVSGGVFAPQTDSAVDLGTSTERFKDAYVDSLTVTNDVTIAGNLTITGATVEVQQAFVVTSSVQFEGITPDGNEISLTTADPTADRTITLPDLDGHVPLLAGAISNANVTAAEFALLDASAASVGTDSVTSGDGFLHNDNGVLKHTRIDKIIDASAGNGLSASGVELSIDMNGMSNRTVVAQGDLITIGANNDSYAAKKISFTNFEDEIFGNVSGDIAIAAGGGATIQANAVEGSMLNTDVISAQTDLASGLASTDELLVSDAGTLKKMDVSVLTTFIGNNASATVQELTNATQTLSVTAGPMVLANRGSAMTITLDSPANHQGKRVIIKKIGAGNVTISPPSGQIDGQALDIVLESPMAAVTIISDGSNYFIV